ncbi:hypothetical protein [Halorussus caseinilyticus]|uniref:hypothetical protein n=1 Tax=Halorussus caseinilyticus TaxID=3034025 RepID=UPI0023E762F9|nr:hypothetical protein [Halorussus sp. DT72]
MKDGTGGDPFADDPPEPSSTTETTDAADTTDTTDAADTTSSADTGRSQSTPETASTADTDTGETTASATGDESPAQLPYYYRRETVKEGRDQVPFFLRDHVQALEDDFIDDLEDRLNASNVYKADAREAALQIVYQNHAAEVANLLREWGYDR